MTMTAEAMMDYEPDDEVEADQMKRIRRAQREANIDGEAWDLAFKQMKEIKLQIDLLEMQLRVARNKNASWVMIDRVDSLHNALENHKQYERAHNYFRIRKLDEDAR